MAWVSYSCTFAVHQIQLLPHTSLGKLITLPRLNINQINQSNLFRERIGSTCWRRLVRAFTACNVEQFGYLACFVGMSWRAEPSDSQLSLTVSSRLEKR